MILKNVESLIVIFDGKPSDGYTLNANHKNYLLDHFDHVVALIERRVAIELVAIDIRHQVSQHCRQFSDCDDIEQLGPVFSSELRRLLIERTVAAFFRLVWQLRHLRWPKLLHVLRHLQRHA